MGGLPRLDRELARDPAFAARADILAPPPAVLDLPERAVVFGTGAFVRGFVNYFVDAANRAGRFNGRIVAVGSTGSGRDQVLNEQGGLYTLSVRGVVDGAVHEERRVIAAVSRALSARDEWDAVLAVARAPELAVVFSNTTEVGIALDADDRADLAPPRSFPGKLTRFLDERARAFDYAPERGVAVVPCELIEDNGARLRAIVLDLAGRWGLDPRFAPWLDAAVPFCNTLVDRIVPGAPAGPDGDALRASLGYDDAMLTACEPYRLFAIEGDAALAGRLGFADADPGVVVAPDVAPYRERKVRLLNGTHTASVSAALLCGLETVREAVEHEEVGAFIRRAMLDDIVPTLDAAGAEPFARAVLDRFANPFIRHALFDITLQGTMKMRVRVVPAIVRHAERFGRVPESLAFGFAAYLAFMRGALHDGRRAAGLPVPADDQGAPVRAAWDGVAPEDAAAVAALVRRVCADRALWDADLLAVPGFADAVSDHLARIGRDGPLAALRAHLAEATAA